jgi:ABC-type antimicrobial peptide transport system permease subunit
MFLSKHVLVGALGGALGFGAGLLSAVYFSETLEGTRLWITATNFSSPGLLAGLLLASVGGATALAVIAGWIPTVVATRQDPAEVLREE